MFTRNIKRWNIGRNFIELICFDKFACAVRYIYIYTCIWINLEVYYKLSNNQLHWFRDTRFTSKRGRCERFFCLLLLEKNDGFEHILNESKTYMVCYCEHWNLNSCQVDTIKIMPFSQNTFSSAWLNRNMICVYKYAFHGADTDWYLKIYTPKV